MRSREEIEKELTIAIRGSNIPMNPSHIHRLQVELLLDIRDMVKEIKDDVEMIRMRQ